MATRPKLYLYVDETGQDTRGQFFLVAVPIVGGDQRERTEQALREAELVSGKTIRKWMATHEQTRAAYLSQLTPVFREIQPLYYRRCGEGTDYQRWTAEAIVGAIQHRAPEPGAHLYIIIDGFNKQERQRVSRFLREHPLPYSCRLHRGTDDSNPFIRLADALAGFVRHVHDGRPYATALWNDLGRFFHEV